jgi:hypothetical protein
MKRLFALLVALLTTASAQAQNAQALPPPPGQGTGMAPPISIPAEPPSQWAPAPEYRRQGTPVVVEREALDAKLARVEALLAAALEQQGHGHGRGKLRKAREELDEARRALAQAPLAYSQPYPQQPQPPSPPPTPSVQPIPDYQLQQLVRAVGAESFSSDKLRVVEDAARYHYFTVAQVSQVLNLFSFSDDRMQAVRMLWPRVLDRENGHRLYGAFKFSSEKEELRGVLASW